MTEITRSNSEISFSELCFTASLKLLQINSFLKVFICFMSTRIDFWTFILNEPSRLDIFFSKYHFLTLLRELNIIFFRSWKFYWI